MADPHTIGITIGRRIAELRKLIDEAPKAAAIPAAQPRLSIKKDVPQTSAPVPASALALAPVINVETAAPVINVETAAPVINVQPAEAAAPIVNVQVPKGDPAIVNVETAAPVINVQPSEVAAPIINVSAAAPLINVEAAAPVINVQASEVAAPAINVETAAPIINVAPAPPTISVETAAPVINIPAPVVNVTTPDVRVAPPAVTVNFDIKPMTLAILALAEAVKGNRGEIQTLQAEMSRQADAIKALADAMRAPRSLVIKDGKPVGIKIGN